MRNTGKSTQRAAVAAASHRAAGAVYNLLNYQKASGLKTQLLEHIEELTQDENYLETPRAKTFTMLWGMYRFLNDAERVEDVLKDNRIHALDASEVAEEMNKIFTFTPSRNNNAKSSIRNK